MAVNLIDSGQFLLAARVDPSPNRQFGAQRPVKSPINRRAPAGGPRAL